MKIIKSIIIIPFALIGGLFVGLFWLLSTPIDLVICCLCDIWE